MVVSIVLWLLIDDFPKEEHLIVLAPITFFLLGNGRTMEMIVPKLNDLETAAVDVEVDVALLEIGGDGLPDLDFWMHPLNGFPCRLADALAMNVRVHEEQFQFSFPGFLVDVQDKTTDLLSIQDNPVGFCFLTIN